MTNDVKHKKVEGKQDGNITAFEISPGGHQTLTPVTSEVDKPETILDEAARITSGDRNKDYGPPEANHQRTADLWAAYLGVEVSRADVCVLNALQKMSRFHHFPKRDSATDVCGYMRNLEMMGDLI